MFGDFELELFKVLRIAGDEASFLRPIQEVEGKFPPP
jgi:hypothetical protein